MKKRFLLAVSACIVFSILLFNCTLNRTAIIIMSGIRIYRAMFLSFAMFAFISFTVLIFTIILYSKNKKVKQKTGMFDNPGMTEADRCRLYDDLHKFGEDKWKDIFNLKDLYTQLDDMNEYQKNLEFLLAQTQYLKEKPADIIQRVEDCMYINIKKLLNYMHVLQPKDISFMGQKVGECKSKNADLLQKAKDFVLAVIDYVNNDMSPGEEERAVDYVNSYMYIVLDAIEKEDIYLS